MKRIPLLLLMLLLAVPISQAAFAADIWPTLEKLEDTRLLFHATMWDIHDARALAVAAEPVSPPARDPKLPTAYEKFGLPQSLLELDDLTKEGLWLYETLMSLDEAGQSLCSYRDSGSAPYLDDDIRMLEEQTAAAAAQVLAFREKAQRAKAERLDALRSAFPDGLPKLVESPDVPWPDPQREWGRTNGISIGWPMLMRPYPESAQARLDGVHGFDSRYVLAKAKKAGVGHVFVLDPHAAAWRDCERKQGEYDFTTLDSILGQIRDAGLRAIIFIPSLTTACPQWFTGTPEERSFVASDGTARSGVYSMVDGRRARDSFSMVQDVGRDFADESVNLHNPADGQRSPPTCVPWPST